MSVPGRCHAGTVGGNWRPQHSYSLTLKILVRGEYEQKSWNNCQDPQTLILATFFSRPPNILCFFLKTKFFFRMTLVVEFFSFISVDSYTSPVIIFYLKPVKGCSIFSSDFPSPVQVWLKDLPCHCMKGAACLLCILNKRWRNIQRLCKSHYT